MITDFCVICGKKDELHNHHIIPESMGGTDESTNLITLCDEHHEWIHQLRPGTWNKHNKLISNSLKEAKELGFKIGRPTRKWEKNDIDNFLKDKDDGMAMRALGKKYKCGTGTVYDILNNPKKYYELSTKEFRQGSYKQYKKDKKRLERIDHNIKERVIGQIDRDGQLLEVWVEKQKEKLVEKTLTKINTLMDEIKPRMVDEYVKKGIFIEDNLDDE